MSGRPPFREYLTQLLERRHFIGLQAWSQSTTKNRGMVLGNLWLVLAPAIDGLIYFVIFGILLQISRGMENFFGYLVIGVFLFSFTTRAVNSAASSIHSNMGLIRAFTFPRASLPVAAVVRETISTLPVFLALGILLAAVPPHASVTVYWLLVPLVFFIQAVFNMGVGFILARVAARFPDARQLIPYLIRRWMYGSAVMFTLERFEAIPLLADVVRANPMYQALTLYRELLLEGKLPDPQLWGSFALWALALFVAGAIFFWRGEVSYGRE